MGTTNCRVGRGFFRNEHWQGGHHWKDVDENTDKNTQSSDLTQTPYGRILLLEPRKTPFLWKSRTFSPTLAHRFAQHTVPLLAVALLLGHPSPSCLTWQPSRRPLAGKTSTTSIQPTSIEARISMLARDSREQIRNQITTHAHPRAQSAEFPNPEIRPRINTVNYHRFPPLDVDATRDDRAKFAAAACAAPIRKTVKHRRIFRELMVCARERERLRERERIFQFEQRFSSHSPSVIVIIGPSGHRAGKQQPAHPLSSSLAR